MLHTFLSRNHDLLELLSIQFPDPVMGLFGLYALGEVECGILLHLQGAPHQAVIMSSPIRYYIEVLYCKTSKVVKAGFFNPHFF